MATPAKNTDADAADAADSSLPQKQKQKPRKLDRKQIPQDDTKVAESQQQNNQTADIQDNGPRSEQLPRGAKDSDETPDQHPGADEEQVPEPEAQPAQQQEESKPSPRAEKPFKNESETETIEHEDAPPPVRDWQRRTRRKRRGQQDQRNQQMIPSGKAGEVSGKKVNDAGELAENTSSNAVKSATDSAGKEDQGKEEQLRLRLDLNLDLEVQLKAKIHGDLTLQLLD